jgi:mono/diheme cytochrome c family protein
MGRLESGASRGIGAWVLLAALLPAAAGAQGTAASAAARTSTMAGVYTSEQADQGKEVFAGNCLGCHTTASHTGPAFLGRWMGRPLAELFDYLSSGMPKSAPGSLTEDEYVWVTAYILKLNGMPAGKTPLTGDLEALATVRVDTAAGVGAERPRRFGARLGRLRTAGDADAAPSLDQSRPALHSRAVPSPARAPGTRAPAASPP